MDEKSIIYNDYVTDPRPLPNVVVPALAPFAAVPSDGDIALGGRCRQIVLKPGSATLALDQNVPNPASKEVSITYSLDRVGPLRVAIVNAVGTPVRTLLEQEGRPGKYQLIFDVSDLRSGVYYYRLDCGGAVRTRAMNILR